MATDVTEGSRIHTETGWQIMSAGFFLGGKQDIVIPSGLAVERLNEKLRDKILFANFSKKLFKYFLVIKKLIIISSSLHFVVR